MLVPGRSLGGIELGRDQGGGRAPLGPRLRRLPRLRRRRPGTSTTSPSSLAAPAVELRNGRVAAVFTLYQPLSWRTTRGVALGDSVTRVTSVYGALVRRECGGYAVLVLPGRGATTAFYVLERQALGVRALPARRAALPLRASQAGTASARHA